MDEKYTNEETFKPIRKGELSHTNKDEKSKTVTKIAIDKLIHYKNHPFEIYKGERLEKLKIDIGENGLHNPILVRPMGDGYEILSGHNRLEAVKKLGWDTIAAIVYNVSDEEAERIVIGANLNQQSFSDWSYSQQIKVIKIYIKHIQKNSQQGKRTDLANKETSVQNEHKSDNKPPKPPKTRDKISKQLGLSPAVFERYRSIAKLEGKILKTLCTMLDEKKIGFMAAHRISQLKPGEQATVLSILNENPEVTIKGANGKLLYDESKKATERELSKKVIEGILLSGISQ